MNEAYGRLVDVVSSRNSGTASWCLLEHWLEARRYCSIHQVLNPGVHEVWTCEGFQRIYLEVEVYDRKLARLLARV
uniref:Uncharacterized protein n=1 Tax=Arundo donax TaxID=35708 RepID=A0A0A9HXI9_ARUDO